MYSISHHGTCLVILYFAYYNAKLRELLYHYYNNNGNLQEKDNRHPVAELAVEGLVAEEVHRQEGGRRAAKRCEEKQRSLGDAAREVLAFLAITDSLVLVDTVGDEGQQIDAYEVVCYKSCYLHVKFSFPAATSKWYFAIPRSILAYPTSEKRARAATVWPSMSSNSNFC